MKNAASVAAAGVLALAVMAAGCSPGGSALPPSDGVPPPAPGIGDPGGDSGADLPPFTPGQPTPDPADPDDPKVPLPDPNDPSPPTPPGNPNPQPGDPSPIPNDPQPLPPPADPRDPVEPAPVNPAMRQNVMASMGAPAQVVLDQLSMLPLAVDAAIEASIQANGGSALVTTGTLTQVVPGQLNFTYDSQPTDRLRVVGTDGTTFEFFIAVMNGDFSSDGANFIGGQHEIDVRVVSAGSDMRHVSSKLLRTNLANDGFVHASAAGTFTYNGVGYTADMTAEGTYYSEVSGGGFEFRNNIVYSGAINGSDGYMLNVNESWDSISVGVDGSAVWDNRRTNNNAWVDASGSFGYRDAVIRTVFRDGFPSEVETAWAVQGALLRDGAPYGSLRLTQDAISLKAVLSTPNGDIEIQSWRNQ